MQFLFATHYKSWEVVPFYKVKHLRICLPAKDIDRPPGEGWGADIDYEDCATQARVLDHFSSVSIAFSSYTSDFHVFNTISAKEGSSHWFSTHREQGSPERSNHSLWGPQLVING